MHLITCTSSILVNDLDSLWHTQHERLHEAIRNISPGGEQRVAESIQSQTELHF